MLKWFKRFFGKAPAPPQVTVKCWEEGREVLYCYSAFNKYGESKPTFPEDFEYQKSEIHRFITQVSLYSQGAVGYKKYIKPITAEQYHLESTLKAETVDFLS